MNRYLEAQQIWDWIQWRLAPDVWIECQQVLRPDTPPVVSDPALSAGLAEILKASTTRARRITLLRQLLSIIKNGG